MRNTRAIAALTVFALSAFAITSCSEKLSNPDNALFDAGNNLHEARVIDHVSRFVKLRDQNVYSFSYSIEEGEQGVNVTLFWDDGKAYTTDAEGNQTEIVVKGGQTELFVHNDDLREILD